jgi:serine/threonine protein kinase
LKNEVTKTSISLRSAMPVRINKCDPGSLRLLVEDLLPPAELTTLEKHLEICADCRVELDRLASADRWTVAARRYLSAEATGFHIPDYSDADRLAFLAPSDWPDSVGRLGTYEVKGVLGHGGMGVVLKAFDPALSRNVAIKVLSAPLATCGAARRRFLREARAAAAVAHEHVVAVHAVVETAGLPFLVMEYVPGRSLQDRLDKQGALSLAEILRIGMQTASGLAAAHAQGLVHRDVKPANILLENGVERVRLTDFGLARAAADAGVTQSGVVAGTPHYMAPEQARAEATDHRADLFSLGSTLYAMCTGHPPFRADSAVAVLRRVSDDTPRPIREINPEIPEWLEAIIAKLHAKSPSQRYQTALQVAELLSRCLAHVREPLSAALPVEAIPMTRRQGARRHRVWRSALSILAIGLSLCGLAAVSMWRNDRDRQNPASSAPRNGAGNDAAATTSAVVRGSDEIDGQFAEVWEHATAIDAHMGRSGTSPANDPISAVAHGLADQAQALEEEIVSGRPRTFRPSNRPPQYQP